MTINGQLKKVIDAWPVLAAVGLLMVGLLTVYAKGFVGDVVKDDITTLPKIIAMDNAITANQVLAQAVKDDTEDIIADINKLDAKLDRLIEIMLTED